jgi:signal peptidase I
MQFITGSILAALAFYGYTIFFGAEQGDFSLFLFVTVVVTGLYWLAESVYFKPKRVASAKLLTDSARNLALQQPWWLDWTAGLFPLLCAMFLLRSFLFEPFKVPTGSMIPSIAIGDMMLVNKFKYGVRLPVLNTKVFDVSSPQRGDIMVFRFPPQPSQNYVKRVIGLPGDDISYLNKVLIVNGKVLSKTPQMDYLDVDTMTISKQFEEIIGDKKHNLLNEDSRPAYIAGASVFPNREHCQYSIEGVRCKVPAGHYFMMGDNRDNSLDSRYWGFVPEANIVGKATFVWMNFSHLNRIGELQ